MRYIVLAALALGAAYFAGLVIGIIGNIAVSLFM